MKKTLILTAAAALMLIGCSKEQEEVIELSHNVEGKKITVGVSFEVPETSTKSDIDDNGNFTWSTEDAILIGSEVTSATSNWGKLDIQAGTGKIGPGYKTATFVGTLYGENTAVASVFPATVQPYYAESTGKLSLTLPKTIAWNDSYNAGSGTMQADNVMVARYVDIYSGGYSHGTTTGLQFYNVGGLFRLTLKNIPAGACKLVFTTDKKINGTFEVKDTVENSVNYPVINTEAPATESEKSVEITFPNDGTNKRVFFIPVPVGSYKIGFAVKDAEDNDLWAFSTSKTNSVARGHMVKMPTLSHVVVSGDGDGATNIIVTPTSFSGDVYLPSTENDVYVKMNETGGTINLKYSQTGNLKPANVYLQALGDITALNINLPNSHVELTGTDDNNVHVVTNVTASTSVSTFVVDNLVRIGKEDVATSGLTITGGSLDLSAPVEGTVTIAIPDETVNATEERVSISIGSAINNLVVSSAATQNAPDKIYVSLGAKSSVTDTLSVPEVNCNLYVAPGAQVKVVETVAAENTIEGKVKNLSASGSGTIVTVTKAGSVTESITSADKATVVIEKRTQDEVTAGTAGEVVDVEAGTTEDGGTITKVDGTVVAYIGSTPYTSLQAAIEAAQANDEIVIQTSHTVTSGYTITKDLVINLNGNTITAEAASSDDSNFPNNRLFKVTGSASLTVKNGTTVLNDKLWGSVRFESTGNLVLTDYVTYNSREWGANIKMSHGNATFTNVSIYADKGGCVDIGDGSYDAPSQAVAVMTNCKFEQTGEGSNDNYKTVSAAVIASCSGHVTLNSGSYSGYYGLFPHSSGGTITVKDGCTVTGRLNAVHTVNHSYTSVHEDHIINIEGGTINGTFDVATDGHTTFSITGGTFDHDPTSYVAEGYTTSGSNPWTVIKREGAVFNLTELQAAISNGVTPIYYAGEAITEAFTLAPAAATVINGLKVNHQTVAANATTLTINGDVTLNDAEITSKAYCAVSIETGKTVTLKDCVVDGSTATAGNSRALNINGGATVTIDGSTVKGPSTAGYSRCINVIDEGAHVDIVNGSVLSVSHYAINLPSTTVNAVINVEDSSVNTGWAITNIWKTGNTINLTNCTLNSVNDKTQAPDNNFSAFVFNNDGTNISSGNTVTVNNCAVSVSSPSGNLQSLISLRGTNDTIKFIGSDGTIALAENGGITYQWGQLHSTLNNTLSFDTANLAQIQEYLNPCLVANGPVDDLYTVSFAATVRAYNGSAWTYYLGLKDALADATNVQINFIDNVVLAEDIVPAQNANGYILIVNGNYTVTTNNHVVKLPADYLVIAQNPINGLFSALDDSYEVSVVDVAVGDETWTGYVAESVAQIGDVKYATVKDAIEAANGMDDATITLVSDVTEAECWTATKSMTLDLNGHTYTNTATANILASYTGTHSSYKASMMFAPAGNGTFTVDATSGGKIVVNPAAADAIGFLVSDNVKNPEYSNNEIQFVVKGKSSSDTVFEFDGNVKYGVLACYRNPSSVLSVKDAKIVSTKTTAYGVTVYLEQIGKVDMNSVCIRSSFPECVCVGDSMLDEGEKRASGTFKNCDFAQTGTGTDWTNVAINMSSNALVEVYSGTYSGNGAALSVATSGGTAKLYGGTFNGKTHRFITTGTSGYDNWAKTAIYYDPSSCSFTGSTEDTVVGSDIVAPFVAQIGETKYATLAEAIAAANATGNVTINLLKDYDFEASEPGYGYTTDFVAEGETTTRNNMLVFSGNNITFDLGNHTISNLFNNTFKVAGTGIVFQNGEMRVGQLYYASKNSPSTPYTTENERTCSYIVYVREATNFTVNNLTTYGGINVSASTATINNLSFSGTKFYAVCSQSSATVTLNGGAYTKAITGATGNLFWIETGSVMNITGGTYIKGNASFRSGVNPVITGGAFDFNPTNFGVKEGFVATETGTGTWTVQEKQTIEGTGQGSTGGTPGAGTDPQFP